MTFSESKTLILENLRSSSEVEAKSEEKEARGSFSNPRLPIHGRGLEKEIYSEF